MKCSLSMMQSSGANPVKVASSLKVLELIIKYLKKCQLQYVLLIKRIDNCWYLAKQDLQHFFK